MAGDELDNLSDDELTRMVVAKATGGSASSSTAAAAPAGPSGAPDNLDNLSDADLDKLVTQKAAASASPSAGDRLANAGKYALENVVVPVGRAVDRFTGSPVRSAISAAQHGENPIAAFLGQIGHDPDQAPTGKDIAKRAGLGETKLSDVFPSLYAQPGAEQPMGGKAGRLQSAKPEKGGILDPTASGAAGLGIDLAADWSNLIPVGLAAKTAGKGVAEAAELGARGAAKATDLATGTELATKALEGAQGAGKTAMKAVDSVVNPTRAADYAQRVAIAQKNGIDPKLLSETLEFGPGSFIARGTRHVAEGPAGEAVLARHAEGVAQINQAIDRNMAKIGGGAAPDAAEAGQILRKGYNDAAEKFFNSMDITYDKVQKYAPGLYVSKDEMAKLQSSLNGIEKYAKGLVSRGVTNTDIEQGRQLLRAVNGVRASNGSFKQTTEALQMIGRSAFKSTNALADIPADTVKLRGLYGDIRQALVNTVRDHVNPQFADELENNNKAMTQFFGDKSQIAGDIGGKNVADEQAFSRTFSNTKKVEAAKALVDQPTWQKLQGAYVRSLVKQNADGSVAFGSTINAMRAKAPILKSVFADNPEALKDLADVLKLGADYGPAVLSHSGTGASHSFFNLGHGIANSVFTQGRLDALKGRARAAAAEAESAGAAAAAAPPASSAGSKIPLNINPARLIGAREGATAQRLKAAQAISAAYPQAAGKPETDARRRARLKALGE
jgi:hypothetical protein